MSKRIAAVTLALLCLAVSGSAQDALMNSAETINKGNFKLAGYPIFLLGDGDNETGVGFRAGYGFGRGFDIEAKLGLFDGVKYYGADAEWWVARHAPDFSLAAGVHRTSFDNTDFDVVGVDGTALVSGHVAKNLELYGGFRVAFEMPDGEADNFQRIHLIPGIEYRISDDLDLLGEVGIKMNDDSSSYAAVGLALYIR
jgi:hypothetical protein